MWELSIYTKVGAWGIVGFVRQVEKEEDHEEVEGHHHLNHLNMR
jgi:hypothetical protein